MEKGVNRKSEKREGEQEGGREGKRTKRPV